MGLLYEGDTYKWMQERDWKKFLDHSNDFDNVYGHYVVVRWSGKRLQVNTDRLGLRTLFITRDDNQNIIFSTRLDWLAKLREESLNVDFAIFSGSWLLIDQISYGCPVEGVFKLGPEANLHIDSSGCSLQREIKHKSFNPYQCTNIKYQSFDRELRKATLCSIPEKYRISLGLSAGLDSRLLLGLLLSKGIDDFHCHISGSKENPDVKIADSIGNSLNLNYRCFDKRVPTFQEQQNLIMKFVSQVGTILPLYEASKWEYADKLNDLDYLHMDGGYGGGIRHNFMYQLTRFNFTSAGQIYSEDLLPYISSPGPRIFVSAIWKEMRESIAKQVEEVWKRNLKLAEGHLMSAAELFVYNTNIQNSSCYAQAWLDHYIPNIMPYVESRVIEREFSKFTVERVSDKTYKKFINIHVPELAHFPLVKDQIKYPFGLNEFGGRIYRKLKRKMGIAETRKGRAKRFLEKNEEFVQDTVRSRGVREYGAYDYDKINGLVQDFYDGDYDRAGALNQWLTFECWRQSLKVGG